MKPKRWLGRFAPYAGGGANLSRGVETTAKLNLANEIATTPANNKYL